MVASVLKNLNIEHTLKTIKGILMRNLIQTFFLKRKIFRQTMESQWHPAKKYIWNLQNADVDTPYTIGKYRANNK